MGKSESTEHIVRYTVDELREMVARGESETDWAAIDAMTDEDIAANIDPEDEGVFDWSTIRLVRGWPEARERVSVPAATVEWFRANAPDDVEGRISQVLADYVEAQRREAS